MARLNSGSLLSAMMAAGAALTLGACQGKTPASEQTAPAAQAASSDGVAGEGAASSTAAAATGRDAVRDLAQLTASDLAFKNPAKDAFLQRYFGLSDEVDGMGPHCSAAKDMTGDNFDWLCQWSADGDDSNPNLLVLMNIVRPDPNIWSVAIRGDYGDSPLGDAWVCGPGEGHNATICTLSSQSGDRQQIVEQWNAFLRAAG